MDRGRGVGAGATGCERGLKCARPRAEHAPPVTAVVVPVPIPITTTATTTVATATAATAGAGTGAAPTPTTAHRGHLFGTNLPLPVVKSLGVLHSVPIAHTSLPI